MLRKLLIQDGVTLVSFNLLLHLAGAIQYMWGTGACTGCLILLRRLAIIVSPYTVSEAGKTNVRFFMELLAGLLIPLLQIPFHIIVQGHRMNEIRDLGCIVPIFPSILSVIFVLCYNVILNLICVVYAGAWLNFTDARSYCCCSSSTKIFRDQRCSKRKRNRTNSFSIHEAHAFGSS